MVSGETCGWLNTRVSVCPHCDDVSLMLAAE